MDSQTFHSSLQHDPANGPYMLECASCRTPIQASDPHTDQAGRLERLQYVREQIESRRGNRAAGVLRFSQGFVAEQALERYFRTVADTQESLRGRFDASDFDWMLNARPEAIWRWTYGDLAAEVLDTFRYAGDADEESAAPAIVDLARRLAELTPIEQVAFADACERVFRGYSNPCL